MVLFSLRILVLGLHMALGIKKGSSELDGDREVVVIVNGSENKANKRIIHDNNDPKDIDIKIDTDIDMITVHTADHQLSINLLAQYPAGYNVFPVEDAHEAVNISLQMALYSIVDMNERDQMLTTNCEIITKWNDIFLTWDPDQYNNITDTRLPWDRVWTPDIVLYNSAGDGEQGREMRTLIQVDYQGNVTLLTQGIYMTKCQIDVSHYPFDPQRCSLKFASWTTEITRLNLSIGEIPHQQILGMYSGFGVFELRNFYAKRSENFDPCCEDPFVYITYYLVIWRKPLFFLFNYIQPSVLINILALFVFLIPAESGEKITLGISTMLNMTIFLMTVMSGLPPTDRTPIVSIYFSITMAVTTAATIMGVIILRIHHKGSRGLPVPQNLRVLAKLLAIVSWSSYPDTEQQLKDLEKGVFRQEAKDNYQYNIKDYKNMTRTGSGKAKSNPPALIRKMSCDILPNGLTSKFAAGERRSSVFARGQMDFFKEKFNFGQSVESEDDNYKFDSMTVDTAFSEQNEEEEKQKEARNRWKRGIGKVVTDVQMNKKGLKKESWAKLIEKVLEDKNRNTKLNTNFEHSGSILDKDENYIWAEMDKMCRNVVEDSWRKFMAEMWEDRWRAEDRKEIIGEEWRKISRILDRFLLILLFLLSFINTIWCIFTSPYINAKNYIEDYEE